MADPATTAPGWKRFAARDHPGVAATGSTIYE
jgi:hypothetical protein